MIHVHAVLPDRLGEEGLDDPFPHRALHVDLDVVGDPEPGRLLRVDPEAVLRVQGQEPPVVLQGRVGEVGITAHEEPVLPLRRLRYGTVGGQGVLSVLLEPRGKELDLPGGRPEPALGPLLSVPGVAGLGPHAPLRQGLPRLFRKGPHLVLDVLVHVVVEVLAQAEPLCQLLHDPVVRLRVEQGLDDLVPLDDEGPQRLLRVERVLALQVGRLREDDVGLPGHVRGEDVDGADELHLIDHPLGLGPVRHAVERVLLVDHPPLHRVRLALEHIFPAHVVDAVPCIVEGVGDGHAVDPGGFGVIEGGNQGVAEADRAARDQAAHGVPVPHDGVDDGNGTPELGLVAVEGAPPAVVEDALGRRIGEVAGDLHDPFGRHGALRGRPLGRVGLYVLLELVESVGVALHEALVVELLFDDHMDHGEHQGQVGAGLDGDPDVGLARRHRVAGVDVDELVAVVQVLEEIDRVRCENRLGPVGPGHDDEAAVPYVREREGAVGMEEAHVVGHQALRGVPEGVGGPEGLGHVEEEVLLEPLGGAKHDALRAVALLELEEFLGRVVQGLFPARPPPLPGPPRPGADKGVLQAVRVVGDLQGRLPPGAEPPLGLRVIRISVQLGHHAVLDAGQHAALVHADGAHRGHGPDLPRGGLLQGRQGAGREDLPSSRGHGCRCHSGSGQGEEAPAVHGERVQGIGGLIRSFSFLFQFALPSITPSPSGRGSG